MLLFGWAQAAPGGDDFLDWDWPIDGDIIQGQLRCVTHSSYIHEARKRPSRPGFPSIGIFIVPVDFVPAGSCRDGRIQFLVSPAGHQPNRNDCSEVGERSCIIGAWNLNGIIADFVGELDSAASDDPDICQALKSVLVFCAIV